MLLATKLRPCADFCPHLLVFIIDLERSVRELKPSRCADMNLGNQLA
jgi:hypothetical protein